MFDPYSGKTNNLSESMNAVLKRENEWKELPVDLLALGFYFLLFVLQFSVYCPQVLKWCHILSAGVPATKVFDVLCIQQLHLGKQPSWEIYYPQEE
jgi:hypothetical protein